MMFRTRKEGSMPAQNLVAQGEKRREEILAFIRTYSDEHGYSPSIAEIGEAVEIVSPNAVRNHLHKLRDEGKIELTPRVARSIRLLAG
jgi:repressor LexA